MVKADAIEALLYECRTIPFGQECYAKFRTVYQRVLLRIIEAKRKSPDHRKTLYNGAPRVMTGCCCCC